MLHFSVCDAFAKDCNTELGSAGGGTTLPFTFRHMVVFYEEPGEGFSSFRNACWWFVVVVLAVVMVVLDAVVIVVIGVVVVVVAVG